MDNVTAFARIAESALPLSDKVEMVFDRVGQDFSKYRTDPFFGMKLLFLYEDAFQFFANDLEFRTALLHRVAEAHAEAILGGFLEVELRPTAVMLMHEAVSMWGTLSKHRQISVPLDSIVAQVFGEHFDSLCHEVAQCASVVIAAIYENCDVEGNTPEELRESHASAIEHIWSFQQDTSWDGPLTRGIQDAITKFARAAGEHLGHTPG